jgi:hypothetical protein
MSIQFSTIAIEAIKESISPISLPRKRDFNSPKYFAWSKEKGKISKLFSNNDPRFSD